MGIEIDPAALRELIAKLGLRPLTPWQEVVLGIRKAAKGTSVYTVSREAARREPYRTVAHVGKPVPEIEAGDVEGEAPE